MEVYTARLDSLDTYCCDHEVAEADMRWVAAPSSLPGATVTICTQQPMPCSPEDDAQTACDPWLSCSLAWEDWSRMPADWKQRGACCTLTLRCCKGCEVRELGSSAGAPDQVSDAWQRQEEVVICKLARWSEVKQAVLDGFTLAAALAVLFRDSCGSSGGSSRGSSDDGGNPGWPGGTASSAASSPTSSSGGGGSGSCSSVSSIGGAGPVGLDDCLFIPGGGPGTFASAKGRMLMAWRGDVVSLVRNVAEDCTAHIKEYIGSYPQPRKLLHGKNHGPNQHRSNPLAFLKHPASVSPCMPNVNPSNPPHPFLLPHVFQVLT